MREEREHWAGEVVVTDSTLKVNFSASLSDIEKAIPGLTGPFGGE